MDQQNEVLEQKKFDIKVPYNHEVIVAERKKQKRASIILISVCTVFFILFAIFSGLSKNSAPWVPALFGGFAVFSLICIIFILFTLKPNFKNDNKKLCFEFYEDYLKVYQDNAREDGKVKMLENCLYRPYQNKQYVSKVVEYENRFQIKIYTGSYNFVPQYKNHDIPKAIFETAEEQDAFKNFLQEKVDKDYSIKTK